MEKYIWRDPAGNVAEGGALELLDLLEAGKVPVTTPVRSETETELLPLEEHPGFTAAVRKLHQKIQRTAWGIGMGIFLSTVLLGGILYLCITFGDVIMNAFWALLLFPWLLSGWWMPSVRLYPSLWRKFQVGLPYWNLVAGPLLGLRRIHGAGRCFLIAAWASYILLVAAFWILNFSSVMNRWIVQGILILMLLSCVALWYWICRVEKKRCRKILDNAGFGGLSPVAAAGDPLRKWGQQERVIRLLLQAVFTPVIYLLLPLAVWLGVLYCVGLGRLHFVRQAVMEAGISMEDPRTRPEKSAPEALAIRNAILTLPLKEPPDSLGSIGNLEVRLRYVDARFWETAERYVAENRTGLDALKKLIAGLPSEKLSFSQEDENELWKFLPRCMVLLVCDQLLRERVGEPWAGEGLTIWKRLDNQFKTWRFPEFQCRSLPLLTDEELKREFAELLEEERSCHIQPDCFDIWTSFYRENPSWNPFVLYMHWRKYRFGGEPAGIRRMTYDFVEFLAHPKGVADHLRLELRKMPLNNSEYYLVREEWIKLKKRQERFGSNFGWQLRSFAYSYSVINLRMRRAGIALEQYKRKYGDWPDNLVSLVPEFLAENPCDPFTGGSFRYEKGEFKVKVADIVWEVGDRDFGGGLVEFGDFKWDTVEEREILLPGVRISVPGPEGTGRGDYSFVFTVPGVMQKAEN